MYKIAVVTMGVRLNDEKGYTRFRYICEFLADAGYQVDLITTTFQHWEKAQRDSGKDPGRAVQSSGSNSSTSRGIRKTWTCAGYGAMP